MLLELPHTRGCLVCGRDNAQGLKLALHVDDDTGVVQVEFTPRAQHIGFEGVIHGGALATVLDEAMVWAATWQGRRFCLCAELTVRFRSPAGVGDPLHITARVASARARLIATAAEVRSTSALIAIASGKYIPLDESRHRAFVGTLVDEPSTRPAAQRIST